MRRLGTPDAWERLRFRAIGLLAKGLTPVEVARKLGVSRRAVRRWKSRFAREGPEALVAKWGSGRPWKLDARGRAKLERLLLRGAAACGFPTDLWTCQRVADLIDREFGVSYHPDHIGRLLRSMGWSPQRPERRARERDEGAIAGWVKTMVPRVKKTPAGRRRTSRSLTRAGS
jgi:transposase